MKDKCWFCRKFQSQSDQNEDFPHTLLITMNSDYPSVSLVHFLFESYLDRKIVQNTILCKIFLFCLRLVGLELALCSRHKKVALGLLCLQITSTPEWETTEKKQKGC